jgi:hypothetical protein
MSPKNNVTKLIRSDTLRNYTKYENLNNNRFLKLEDWNSCVHKNNVNYFTSWKKTTLLEELYNNPNFIKELDKTHEYEILSIGNVYVNHPTASYLNTFLQDNLSNSIHFFFTKLNPKVISNNYNILMPSPGHITQDKGSRYSTGSLSNVLIKVRGVNTDELLPTANTSKSYTFSYNYQLVNTEYVNYDVITNLLGEVVILPIFSLEKIHSIQNYSSYLALHPNNSSDSVINSLSEVSRLGMDLIWLNKFYEKYFKLRKLNLNLSDTDVVNFVEELSILLL